MADKLASPMTTHILFIRGGGAGKLDLYEKEIPGAHVRRLKGRDHQLNNDLTEVADDIRRVGRQGQAPSANRGLCEKSE